MIPNRTTVVRYSELLQLVLTLAEKHRMPSTVPARLAESLAEDAGRPLTPIREKSL